jgi:YVTN family beta-propeller protein
MLDGKSLNKIAEFPTEGTPCSVCQANGQIFIADQGKHRILILDPVARKFHGQIDLPPRCAPKGIAALPNGKWLYVSESAVGAVACVETSTGKVLLKTKTHPGPGRMAITPDGVFVIVLNVTSGEVTIISTYNQQVVSTFRVGDMPTSVVISHDSKLAYVSNRLSNTVSVIDVPGHRVLNVIKTGAYPTGLALSPDSSKLYVSCARENTVTAYDTKNLAKLQEVHTPQEVEFPGFLCMLPGGQRMILCSQQSDAVAVLDTEQMQFEKSLSLGHANHEATWEPVP